jgi:hypothetical protein
MPSYRREEVDLLTADQQQGTLRGNTISSQGSTASSSGTVTACQLPSTGSSTKDLPDAVHTQGTGYASVTASGNSSLVAHEAGVQVVLENKHNIFLSLAPPTSHSHLAVQSRFPESLVSAVKMTPI